MNTLYFGDNLEVLYKKIGDTLCFVQIAEKKFQMIQSSAHTVQQSCK